MKLKNEEEYLDYIRGTIRKPHKQVCADVGINSDVKPALASQNIFSPLNPKTESMDRDHKRRPILTFMSVGDTIDR